MPIGFFTCYIAVIFYLLTCTASKKIFYSFLSKIDSFRLLFSHFTNTRRRILKGIAKRIRDVNLLARPARYL
jgi:hypothetical protein